METTVRERSDEELLLAARAEPEAFALFYRRHVRALAAYFWRRSQDAEVTADLTAETFAAALDGCGRFDPERGPAIGWLYGIAHRQLGRLARRGAVETRYRRRLGMPRIELHDDELERIEADAVTARGYARSVAALLERRGARVVRVDAAPAARQTRKTEVFFGRGRLAEGRARLVAQALEAEVLGPASPASSVPVSPLAGGDDVDAVVVLGIDRLQPSAAARIPARPVPATPSRPLSAPTAALPAPPGALPRPAESLPAPTPSVPAPSAPPADLPVPARPETP